MDELADVYDACARAGLADPRRVDELEFWEVAALLGLARPSTDEQAPQASSGGRDLVAERLYAYEHGLPPPEPDPPQPRDPRIGTLVPFAKRRGA